MTRNLILCKDLRIRQIFSIFFLPFARCVLD